MITKITLILMVVFSTVGISQTEVSILYENNDRSKMKSNSWGIKNSNSYLRMFYFTKLDFINPIISLDISEEGDLIKTERVDEWNQCCVLSLEANQRGVKIDSLEYTHNLIKYDDYLKSSYDDFIGLLKDVDNIYVIYESDNNLYKTKVTLKL